MLDSEIYFKSLKRFDCHISTNKKENENKDDQVKNSNMKDNLEKDKATIGKITNLMSVDTNRICKFSTVWNGIIDCPIELVTGVYFLYQLLGSACLFGLLVLCVTFPINHQTSKLYAKTQDNLMKARDYRVNLMHEVCNFSKAFKFERKTYLFAFSFS